MKEGVDGEREELARGVQGGGLIVLMLSACVGEPTADVASEAIMGSAPLDVILTGGRVDTNDPRQHARDASVHFRAFTVPMVSRCSATLVSPRVVIYLAAGVGGVHVIALAEVSFNAVRVRGVRLGVGRLPPATTALRADSRGVSVLTDHALGLEVVDHALSSFSSGGMGLCL